MPIWLCSQPTEMHLKYVGQDKVHSIGMSYCSKSQKSDFIHVNCFHLHQWWLVGVFLGGCGSFRNGTGIRLESSRIRLKNWT